MRVLHIGHIVRLAGAESRLMRTLPRQRSAGIDARLLMLFKPHKPVPAFVAGLESAGVPLAQVPVPHTDSLINPHMVDVIRRTSQAIKDIQPDIVQTHQIYSNFYGTIAARLVGVRRVIATRVNLGDFYQQSHWQVVNWALWKFRASGMVISNAVRDYVVRYEHVSPGKIRTIYNAFDVPPDDGYAASRRQAFRESLQLGPETPIVGSVARFVGFKALPVGIEAFAKVHARLPEAHYALAGDGPLRDDLVAQVARLGLSDAVHFLGWRNDMDTVYDGIDVFLHPSVGEGFGNVLCEAMIHRLPIVGARAGSLPEIVVDGKTGYLGAPHNANSLVEPLLRLLTNPGLRRRFGETGRCRVAETFSSDTQAAAYLDFYNSVMSGADS